jgi:hypothetical protein
MSDMKYPENMGKYALYDCVLRDLPKIHDRSGNLTSVTGNEHIPFMVKRIYYLYDVPTGTSRGGHAHYNMHQLIVAVSGSFDVLLEDGLYKKVIFLNRPDVGLYVTPGIWRELMNFSAGATCMVMASTKYNESDYIRDYHEFKTIYSRNAY